MATNTMSYKKCINRPLKNALLVNDNYFKVICKPVHSGRKWSCSNKLATKDALCIVKNTLSWLDMELNNEKFGVQFIFRLFKMLNE